MSHCLTTLKSLSEGYMAQDLRLFPFFCSAAVVSVEEPQLEKSGFPGLLSPAIAA